MPPAKINKSDLSIRTITATCDRSKFSCENEPINAWFRNDALLCHEDLEKRVRVAFLAGRRDPVGFYALTLRREGVSRFENTPAPFPRFFNESILITLHLHLLAVTEDVCGCGIGTILMGSVLDDFLTVADRAGVGFLTLTSLSQKSRYLYKKMGFQPYDLTSGKEHLFIPASQVMQAAAAANAALQSMPMTSPTTTSNKQP